MRTYFEEFAATFITVILMMGIIVGIVYIIMPKYEVLDDGRVFNTVTGSFLEEAE